MATLWYENPGQDGMFWKLPFQVGAKWIRTGPMVTTLRNGGFGVPTAYVHLPGDFAVPFVIGKATDPLVTIVDGAGHLPTFTLHIPLGTVQELPVTGTDNTLGVVDITKPYALYTLFACTINTGTVQASGTVITAAGIAIDDGSGQLMMDVITGQPGTGNAFGTIQDFELTRLRTIPGYVIPHMIAYELDPNMCNSDPPAWPLEIIDISFPPTGALQQGLTIGIPADVAMPAGKSAGFQAWFNVFQRQGGFFYNVSGNNSLSTGIFQSDPANATLAADMAATLSDVMNYICILDPTSGLAGAQYSLATQKGMVGGVRNDAFPAPDTLDLSPTGGITVKPSTFKAWYPSTQSPFNATTGTGYDVAAGVPTPTGSAWDPAFKSNLITLSNGNRTATSAAAAAQLVRSTTSKSTGLVFLEFTLNTVTNDIAVGICNGSETTAPGAGLGGDGNSAGFYGVSPAQSTFAAGNFLNGGTEVSVNGEIVSMAINFNTAPPTMWVTSAAMRDQGATWNNDGTANPATGIGGQPLTGIGVGPYFAAFNDDNGGAVCTVNFGVTAFSRPLPAGYSAWDVASVPGSTGTAAGLATVTGRGAARVSSVGTSHGAANVLGISPGSHIGVGNAAGVAFVSGASNSVIDSITPPFDFTPTIISQYANSPTLTQLISNFADVIDPVANLDAFYNLIWNVDTAVGYGLDVWGRIVGVGRVLNVAAGLYFGFAEPADNVETPFNSGGPFYSGAATTGSFALTDDAFRLLIFAKALSNITDGSIPSINQILLTLFPGRGNCYVIDNRDMSMIFHFNFPLTPVEAAIVLQSGILPKPVGVSFSIQQAG